MHKTLIAALLLASSASAQDDASFLEQVLSAEVIELNFLWGKDAPVMPLNPPYTVALHTSHKETDGMVPGRLLRGRDDVHERAARGSHDRRESVTSRPAESSTAARTRRRARARPASPPAVIEEYPKEKFVNRGVLLDVARYKGVEVLASDYVITDTDLEETARAQGVEIAAGDSVLIHTGTRQVLRHAIVRGTWDRPRASARPPPAGWPRRTCSSSAPTT